jgi:hypothetical protein
MPWARLDDDFHDNGKILGLSHQAFRLYVCAITYSRRHRTGGVLTASQVWALCGQQRVAKAAVQELVEHRAWHADEARSGYQIHDFDQYQPKSDETAAERMRRHRGRAKPSDSERTVTVRDDGVTRNGDAPVPMPSPNPVPSQQTATPSEPIHQDGAARAPEPIESVRAFAVPKPGLAPGSPHLALQRALAAALHCAEPETASERRKWTAPIAEMVRANVTAAEVPRLVATFGELNSVPCTPQGIVNQLTRLRSDEPVRPAANGRRESTRSQLDRVFGSLA